MSKYDLGRLRTGITEQTETVRERIAMYEPTALAQAVETIKKQREDRINAKASQAERSEGDCALLFVKLAKMEAKELRGIGFCLTEQEKKLLVKYMFRKVKDADQDEQKCADAAGYVEKYSVILTEEMSEEMAIELYRGCQEYYGSPAMMPLYAQLSESTEFAELYKQRYKMDAKRVMDAFRDNTIGELMNKEATAVTSKTGQGYPQALESIGVLSGTRLYNRCMVFFVVVCDTDDYRNMGPEKLVETAQEFSDDMLLKLMANIVQHLDTVQLRKFVQLVGKFIPLTGPRGSEQFNQVMMRYGLEAVYQERYSAWMNQYIINKAFGECEASDFWYSYANKTSMELHTSGVVIIRFNNFVVVESPKGETAFFYGNEYFNSNVRGFVEMQTDEDKILDYLNTQTGFGGTGEYANNWKKAHRGSWKFDVMDYINKHNR